MDRLHPGDPARHWRHWLQDRRAGGLFPAAERHRVSDGTSVLAVLSFPVAEVLILSVFTISDKKLFFLGKKINTEIRKSLSPFQQNNQKIPVIWFWHSLSDL